MVVNLKNKNNLLKQAPMGFSWTTFFFGALTPLFRGDIRWFLVIFVIDFATISLGRLVFAFIYNDIYISSLMESGFIPADPISKNILTVKSIKI